MADNELGEFDRLAEEAMEGFQRHGEREYLPPFSRLTGGGFAVVDEFDDSNNSSTSLHFRKPNDWDLIHEQLPRNYTDIMCGMAEVDEAEYDGLVTVMAHRATDGLLVNDGVTTREATRLERGYVKLGLLAIHHQLVVARLNHERSLDIKATKHKYGIPIEPLN